MPWILLHQTWQIYPRSASRSIPHQLSIDALNTITPNLADLLANLIFGRSTPHQSSINALNTITPNLADLIFGRSAWQIYPRPIKHRCLEYHYTKLGRSTGRSHIWQNCLADLPPPIKHRCLEYHYTKLGRSTGRSHIWQICLADLPPHQLSIDALNTVTPNLADLPQICQQIYPPSIEHRCLEYHYTKLGRSTGKSHIWQIYPPPIEHKCLEYHYTKLGRSHIW